MQARNSSHLPNYVAVVPVRMQEAWLLFSTEAIRYAAGNPNGKMPLALPMINRHEQLPNPKEILYDAIRLASGLSGRRLKKLNINKLVYRIAERIHDFSPLLSLEAYKSLVSGLRSVLQQ